MSVEAVLRFLDERNRPYSALDVQNGLKGSDFTKGAIQKALDSLVADGRIKEKTYGKQKVYFVAQNTNLTSKEVNEQILALDRQINEITTNLQEVSGKLKVNTAQLEQAKGKLSLSQAIQKKSELEDQLRSIKDMLKKFEGVDPIKVEVKNRVQENYDKYLGAYRKRKRMCLDILDSILENYPKTKKHLYEDIGIETDEDAGFAL